MPEISDQNVDELSSHERSAQEIEDDRHQHKGDDARGHHLGLYSHVTSA